MMPIDIIMYHRRFTTKSNGLGLICKSRKHTNVTRTCFLSFFSTNDLLLMRFAQRARLGVSWNTLKNHYISLQRIDHHKINDIVMPFIMWSAAHRFTFHNLSRMLFRLKSSLLFCFKRVGKDSKMYESKISCCVLFELKRASIHFSAKYFYTHAQKLLFQSNENYIID